MKFSIEEKDSYTVIASNVEKLDSLVALELKSIFKKITSEGQKYVILDLATSRYCDSMGLSTMLTGNKLCKNSGGVLVICNIQPFIEKVLYMSQLESVLNIVPNREEAIEFLKMFKLEQKLKDEN